MAASAVYKLQVRVAGAYRGSIMHPKVAGTYHNPKSVYVKVSGVWKLAYSKFTWYYYWEVGGWSGCAYVGAYNTRPVWCKLNPEAKTVSDSYCDPKTKPVARQYCNCHCACACC